MKRNWLIGCSIAGVLGVMACGGVGFLIYLGVSAIIAATQPVVDASNDFLGLLGQDKTAEAYAATGSVFRAQYDEASFTAAVKQLGLTDYASASWNNRKFENQTGSVEGTVTTKNGSATPAAIQLVSEQGKWKVVEVRYGGVELTDVLKTILTKQTPSEAELRDMATETLLDFDEALKAKDFTAFHGKISALWQKQATPVQLKATFQEAIDKGMNLAAIKNVAPQFDAPAAINADGILEVAGHYPTKPVPVKFTLKYLHEAAGWKLFGLHVDIPAQ